MDGFSAVSGNVSMNTYTAFDLVGSGSSIVGVLAIFGFIFCVAFLPKHVRRLLVGYVILAAVGFVCLVLYVLAMSIEPIGNFLFYDVCHWIGDLIIQYWVYILVSLPLAYLAGVGSEKFIFGEEKKRGKKDG